MSACLRDNSQFLRFPRKYLLAAEAAVGRVNHGRDDRFCRRQLGRPSAIPLAMINVSNANVLTNNVPIEYPSGLMAFLSRTPQFPSREISVRCSVHEEAMPARIVVVHNEPTFREPLVASLKASGYDVTAFEDVSAAWNSLAAAECVEILVTRVDFGPGKPHGISLARSARMRRPTIRVLIVARPEYAEDAAGVGLFLPYPVDVPTVAETVERMLADDRIGSAI
jgi:CheY-like chemotaxis protein